MTYQLREYRFVRVNSSGALRKRFEQSDEGSTGVVAVAAGSPGVAVISETRPDARGAGVIASGITGTLIRGLPSGRRSRDSASSIPTASRGRSTCSNRAQAGNTSLDYQVIATTKTGTFEKELNAAAAKGLRFVPESLIGDREKGALGGRLQHRNRRRRPAVCRRRTRSLTACWPPCAWARWRKSWRPREPRASVLSLSLSAEGVPARAREEMTGALPGFHHARRLVEWTAQAGRHREKRSRIAGRFGCTAPSVASRRARCGPPPPGCGDPHRRQSSPATGGRAAPPSPQPPAAAREETPGAGRPWGKAAWRFHGEEAAVGRSRTRTLQTRHA